MTNLASLRHANKLSQTRRLPTIASKYYYLRWQASSADAKDDIDDNNNNNSFKILGVPRTFGLDAELLKQSYRSLMKDYHPDKHSTKSPEEQNRLEKQAAQVNRAFDTLKEPHLRAVHLLQVLGQPMEESATGSLVGKQFLMEIMEIRETVDSADGDDALSPLLAENRRRMDQTCDALEAAFEAEDLDRALEVTAQLQYWNRIDETIREKMEHIE